MTKDSPQEPGYLTALREVLKMQVVPGCVGDGLERVVIELPK